MRLIDADILLENMNKYLNYMCENCTDEYGEGGITALKNAILRIKDASTVTENDEHNVYGNKCSACGGIIIPPQGATTIVKYCPWCRNRLR